MQPLLEVRGLATEFRQGPRTVRANADISLSLAPGRTLGIVGESGSGKSVLLRSILRLIPSPAGRIAAGSVLFEGRDLLTLPEREMRAIRGTRLAMVFQNPMTSLDPVWPVGDQIAESLRVHGRMRGADARRRAVELMRLVGIPSPQARFHEYPHQWSGGMLQRAVIAMAMAGEPRLLLADEPTTALDVTIQDQILALLVELQERTGMAMILVSHDMAIVAETCDEVAVMYAGRILEHAPTGAIFAAPQHPYTAGLLGSIPHGVRADERLRPIAGQPPDLTRLPPGCPFFPRCRYATPDCAVRPVALYEVAAGHATACHYPERLRASAA